MNYALSAVLTMSVSFVWLNLHHLVEATVKAAPSLPPVLTTSGLLFVPWANGPTRESVGGLTASASAGLVIALYNLGRSNRPWVRMGMFLLLIAVIILSWELLSISFSVVNPANASDPEIASVVKEGMFSLRVNFLRGDIPATITLWPIGLAYSVALVLLSYPGRR